MSVYTLPFAQREQSYYQEEMDVNMMMIRIMMMMMTMTMTMTTTTPTTTTNDDELNDVAAKRRNSQFTHYVLINSWCITCIVNNPFGKQ